MSIMFAITEKAVGKIKEISEKENKVGYGLRVRASAGGCSGPKYQLGLDEKAEEGDQVVESNGFKIFIDPESAEFVNSASLDFIESSMGGGFKISNPNVQETGGGCGSGGGGHGHEHGGSGGGCGSGGCGSGGGGEHGSGGGCGSGGCGCG